MDKPVEEKVEKEENGKELESETAEQEEADKNDDSKNDENKLEKILRNIEDIDGKVEVLNDLFLKKIQSIEFEKKTTDRLYKELQEYKNDMYFQLIKPVVMSLVSLRESMKKNLKSFGVMSEEDKIISPEKVEVNIYKKPEEDLKGE